jgi:hypothetical protein
VNIILDEESIKVGSLTCLPQFTHTNSVLSSDSHCNCGYKYVLAQKFGNILQIRVYSEDDYNEPKYYNMRMGWLPPH